ncbi:MAG: hypothetical protein Q8R28_07975 [Dehalococcoidia bacterium]|nr:hypothetical protein [Dehalococcoidia bacterium]
MRIMRRIPALSGQVSAGGGVTSGVYQGSGGLYFTLGDVGVLDAVQVNLNRRNTPHFAGSGVPGSWLNWYTNEDESTINPNQVRVAVINGPLISGGSASELGSGANLSGVHFVIDAEAEV